MVGDSRWFRVEPARGPAQGAHPLRHWSRWPVIVGLSILVVAMPLEWGRMEVQRQVVIATGLTGSADGLIAVVFAAGLLFVASLRGVTETQTRALQLLPALMGVATLLVALDGYVAVDVGIGDARAAGGTGEFLPGMWVELAGAAIAALGGLAVTLVLARNGRSRDRGATPEFDAEFKENAIVAGAGLVVGIVVTFVLLFNVDGKGAAITVVVGPVVMLLMPFVFTFFWRRIRGE